MNTEFTLFYISFNKTVFFIEKKFTNHHIIYQNAVTLFFTGIKNGHKNDHVFYIELPLI